MKIRKSHEGKKKRDDSAQWHMFPSTQERPRTYFWIHIEKCSGWLKHPKSQHGDDSGTSIGQAHEDPKASLHLPVSFSAKAVAIVGLE